MDHLSNVDVLSYVCGTSDQRVFFTGREKSLFHEWERSKRRRPEIWADLWFSECSGAIMSKKQLEQYSMNSYFLISTHRDSWCFWMHVILGFDRFLEPFGNDLFETGRIQYFGKCSALSPLLGVNLMAKGEMHFGLMSKSTAKFINGSTLNYIDILFVRVFRNEGTLS